MKIKDVKIKTNSEEQNYLLVTMEDDSRFVLHNVGTPLISQLSEDVLKEMFS